VKKGKQLLKPGQQAIYTEKGIEVKEVNAALYCSWIQDLFNHTRLPSSNTNVYSPPLGIRRICHSSGVSCCIVQSGKQRVEVLGTSFDVTAYEGEPGIYTTLLQGSVEVSGERVNNY